ncbi:MAG: hypothetical protein HYT48_02335 [Candidatus Vogelbacteria bacterium]|nr:hypothetical protein [Candidatus Vogelbacteria bacterium]
MLLSVWPTLFNYSFFAPLLLRVVLGVVLVVISFKADKIMRMIWVAGGPLLILGLFTQVVAAILALGTLVAIARSPRADWPFHILILAVLLALLTLGPGTYALDLPL